MNFTVSSPDDSLWLFSLAVVVVIFFKWMAKDSHKTEIRNEVVKLKARLVRIRWLPMHGGGDKGDTFYDVTLILPAGNKVSVVCKCNDWDGVCWESTPWLVESAPAADLAPLQPHQMIADCSRCGYGIQQGWKTCPNCGTEVGP